VGSLLSVDLQEEWAAALHDAGLSGDEAALFVMPGAKAKDGQTEAVYFHPSIAILPDRLFRDEDEGVMGDANNGALDLHRVFLWGDADPLMLVARMRHELEHARQWRVHGRSVQDLQELLYHALSAKVADLSGTADLYHLLPAEMDANAAAAVFVRGRHRSDVEERFADPCPVILRSNTGPEPVETLPVRTVAYASLFAAVCDAWAHRNHDVGFGRLLQSQCPGAQEVWERLIDPSMRCTEVRSIDGTADGIESRGNAAR